MRWLFLLGMWVVAEVGGYYGLKRLGVWRRWMGWSSVWVFVGLLLLYGLNYGLQQGGGGKVVLWVQRLAGGLFLGWLALVLGKLVGGVFGLVVGWRRVALPAKAPVASGAAPPAADFSPGRRATLQLLGTTVAALPAVGLGYGFWVGRYRFRLHELKIALPNLPPSWEGVRLVQFSDLHSGSFPTPALLEPAWELVEKAQPHLIAFTGDWVNVYGWELEPFVPALAQLKAPLGKWAVLGNHDYGDYAHWSDPEARKKDHAHLRALIAQAGFHLLDNAAVCLDEDFALVGVGNWSAWRRFQRYGDLAKAWEGVPPGSCAILLSHDPTHWSAQVQGRYPIALTLSGHTHGLQVGIEGATFRFSPAAWLYPHWAGLYRAGNQLLYVNRGLGYIGLPARLGIWPEVTCLTLTRAEASRLPPCA